MKPSEETRIGRTLIAAQERIRLCLCQSGAATQWHLEKAEKVARKPKLLQRIAPHLEGEPAKEYLAALPGWIEQTKKQDAKCGEVWDKRRADYPAQREHLVAIFLRYQFALRSYEKLARQPALVLAATKASARKSRHDEAGTRMTEEDYADLQAKIDADLQKLDQARAELVAGHEELLQKLVKKSAEKSADSIEEITAYARGALDKAAECFDSRQGRRFSTYAQWWIKTAIKEKKTWDQ